MLVAYIMQCCCYEAFKPSFVKKIQREERKNQRKAFLPKKSDLIQVPTRNGTYSTAKKMKPSDTAVRQNKPQRQSKPSSTTPHRTTPHRHQPSRRAQATVGKQRTSRPGRVDRAGQSRDIYRPPVAQYVGGGGRKFFQPCTLKP